MVRFREDEIFVLSRADRQVKFRGFGLSSIGEQVLTNRDSIANATVVMIKNNPKGLVGYVQPELDYAESFDLAEYRE